MFSRKSGCKPIYAKHPPYSSQSNFLILIEVLSDFLFPEIRYTPLIKKSIPIIKNSRIKKYLRLKYCPKILSGLELNPPLPSMII
jgi:hypothetical protein